MMTNGLKGVYGMQSTLMKDHYERALEAKRNGIPIVYVTAMFPVEIVRAFEPDVFTVYPENHSVSLIVRGQGENLAQEGEILGVDRMGCAYELINTGYLAKGHGKLDAEDLFDAKQRPLPKLPEPDVLLACDNQCRIICEWFKHISEISGNKPFKMVNVGDHLDGRLESEQVEWVVSELKGTIALLEEVTGKKLDRDRLLDVATRSKKATQLWREYLALGTQTPSPVSVFDASTHMSLIVSERGRQEAIDYYQALIDATKDAATQHIFPVKAEKHRLLWDNIVTWPNFRDLKALFTENNLALVGSNYLDAWMRTLDVSNYDALLESMADAYSTMYTTYTVPQRIELYKEMVADYNADGVIFHNNLSCHTASLRVDQIAKALENHFGPEFRTVTFEGCQGIEGRFQKHAFETGLNVHFIER